MATIGARIISSLYNYLLNARVVFKKSNKSSLIKYGMLCVIQMLISAFLVNIFSKSIKINVVIIKIVVDAFIFLINFIIQRELIFKNEKKK